MDNNNVDELIRKKEEKKTRKKIIVVDDVVYMLMALKNRLKEYYEIYPADSVSKMFDILDYIKPDLILLDVNMPEVNGFEAIQRLKADVRFAEIPVIFLTAKTNDDHVFTGLNLGAAAYVSKPFSTAVLVEQIENVFNPSQKKNPFDDFVDGKDADKPCVLAVDDVAFMLTRIYNELRDKYRVYTLTKPENLKGMLYNIKPDLFLLDCNMPLLSGFDLVPIIRTFPEHKNTPIIFITSDGTSENMTMAAELGVCDFIVKPINSEMLHKKIEKHIRKKI